MTNSDQPTPELSRDKLDSLVRRLKEKRARRPEAAEGGGIPRREDAAAEIPLSFVQEQLWFLAELQPDDPSYNLPIGVRLRGPLHRAALDAALARVMSRHEILRTTFAASGGKPYQQIQPVSRFAFPAVDLAGLPEAPAATEAVRLTTAAGRIVFDLARGPLLWPLLVRLGPEEHLVSLVLHHIVADGWSLGILLSELGAAYAACRERHPLQLPELPIQYADFAVWQRSWLPGEVLGAQLDFWRNRLAGAPPVLDLPTDRPRPPVRTSRGFVRRVAVPGVGLRQLEQLARPHGATPFMLLLAAFDALLLRYTGREDLLLGTPVANRTRTETQGLIGFFVNTVVLRTDLGGDPRFTELLSRVRETVLQAWSHQDLPFDKLVEELAPERSLAHSPLIQVLFVLQGTPLPEGVFPGLAMSRYDAERTTAKFDLTCELEEVDGGLGGTIEFSQDLYDPPSAERMVRHFAVLLAGVVADPGRRLSDLPLLTPAEQAAVVGEWNDTAVPREAGFRVHLAVARQAARQPDAVALAWSGGVLTYGELLERSGRWAAALRGRGVGPDVRVAVCAGRTAERVVGILAALLAGGAYVGLDPSYPPERLGFQLADSRAAVVLAERAYAERLPAVAVPLLVLDDLPSPVPAGEIREPEPGHVAYVIYTSGSTGRPKGSENTHRGFANLIQWCLEAFPIRPGEHSVQTVSPAFDVSVVETWCSLVAGGTLHLAQDDELRLSSSRLRSWLAEEGITASFISTPMTDIVLEEAKRGSGLPSTVRTLVTGGDRLHRRPPAGAGFHLVNIYGPSEVAVVSTAEDLRPPAAGDADTAFSTPPSIGRAIDNVRVYVVDRSQNPLPVGVPGELWVAGPMLSRGYIDRPVLTAERFRPDPFAAAAGEPGARAYRTGDLVRWMADGRLDFLGRIDHQVKLRGLRIELGEIEVVLGQHPAVQEAVVLVHDDRLLACVVPAGPEVDPDLAAELRQFLRQHLPEFMVPAAFVPFPALPLNPNGKVDRPLLAGLAAEAAAELLGASAAGSAPPSSATERQLAEIWEQLLKIQAPGIHDSFFDLGGHSLLATQLMSRIREVFGVDLPLRRLFEAPTIAGLAAGLGREEREPSPAGSAPIPPAKLDDGLLPLSFAQERLWLIDQLSPGSALYNVPLVLRIEGRLDLPALAAAFGAVIARHETLRSTFPEFRGRPLLRVAPAAVPALPQVDLSALPGSAAEARVWDLAETQAALPFDLAAGPLLRILLVRRSEEQHLLVVTLHHIVADGWSLGILVRELGTAYGACREPGLHAPLPPLPIRYADFAQWQREQAEGELFARQLAFWQSRLAGAPPVLELPTDSPRAPFPSSRGDVVPVVLSEVQTAALRRWALREGATPAMALLAAWNLLLARYAGQREVSVGLPVAGRNRLETEELIGLFVNTLVLRTDLGGDPRGRELLGRVREQTLAAYAHQDLPFERLVDALHPERDLARSPLFQVLFVLQNLPVVPLALSGVRLIPGELPTRMAKFDLTLALAEEGARLAGVLEYASELWGTATMSRLAGHYVHLLDQLADSPESPLSALTLLPAVEEREVLYWGEGAPAAGEDLAVEALLARWAAERPGAPAVVWEGGSWSFAELERQVASWRRRLEDLGVAPGDRVAVCRERSPELIAVLVAVLELGAAYLPLDPSLPESRRSFVLADARPAVLVGEGVDIRRLAPPVAARPVELAPELPAYLIYTSGSTGQPKASVVSQRGLANLLGWFGREFAFGPDDRTLLISSIAFDLSQKVMLTPLLTGGELHLLPPGPYDPEVVLSTLAGSGITWLNCTPSAFEPLLAGADAGERLASLRLLFLGGEPVSRARLERWSGRRAEVVNTYGPTECSDVVSFRRLEGGEPATGLPAGSPVAGLRLRLLSFDLALQPAGIPGQLAVSGVGVGAGYWDQPDRTAASFRPDPFAAEPGGRLYLTGDRALWNPEGDLEILGRLDDQVKVRGFRIELGEIEAVLARHPGVRDCAVVVQEGPAGDRRLVAFVVPAEGGGPEEQMEWSRFLADSLPEPMVPAVWKTLEALPLSANGKVDRRALARRNDRAEAAPGAAGRAEPRSPVEETLATLWAETLGYPEIGIRDNFFALGGHSLLATRLMSRVRETFGVGLPLRVLFAAPTVADFAPRLAARLAESEGEERAASPSAEGGELPLSFAQERMWFLDQLDPGNPVYNIALAVDARGQLEPAVLAASFRTLVRRHEPLRSRFLSVDGKAVLKVGAEDGVSLPWVDLAALPASGREAEEARLSTAEPVRPFDLAQGPLLRTVLLRLGAERHRLLLTVHHIVSDGWSSSLMIREIAVIYGALIERRPPPLPPLPAQYADFARWQRERLQGPYLAAELAHWRERLEGVPPLLLPTDRPRSAMRGQRGATLHRALPAAAAGRLADWARGEGATLFMALLTGFQSWLGRYAGQSDFAVGSPIANRNRAWTEELIGLFVNTLALRTDLTGAPSVRQALDRARQVSLEAFDHQDVPFERLVEELHPERNPSLTPLVQVMLTLQNLPAGPLALPGLTLEGVPLATAAARFDLTLTVDEGPEGLGFALEYDRDLFDAATMERWLGHLNVLLTALPEIPERHLAEVPWLTPQEARQLADWNHTPVAWPEALRRPIPERFAAQVEKAPDAVVVVEADSQLSYGGLAAAARRLSEILRAAGVGPGERVGVAFGRSTDYVVSALGVLGTGGAYVPLDPSYPAERLARMIEDAGLLGVVGRDGWRASSPEPTLRTAGLVYVIFTSGSTGRPKGAGVYEHSYANLLAWYETEFFDATDRTLVLSSVAFDMTQKHIWTPLLSGGRLILGAELYDPAELAALIERERVTCTNSTPSALFPLVETGASLSTLRTVFVGGEPMSPVRLTAWRRSSGFRAEIVNTYGPTECTDVVAFHRLAPPSDDTTASPLGGPLPNVQLRILDPAFGEQPVGVAGQVAMGGICVGAGYLGDPRLTAAKFVPNPFATEPGDRIYLAGDLARRLESGDLDYLGRIDHQVKVRGFRVETGEVEAVLAGCPEVREAVVLARAMGDAGAQLVAWVVAREGHSPTAAELRRQVAARLPEYMVPGLWVFLPAFPLSPNGKIDRKNLPDPVTSRSAAPELSTVPRSETEQLLCDLFGDLLGATGVGSDDSFFELGGHSLLATRLVSRLREVCGVDLPLRRIFEAPTPARLAEVVTAALRSAAGAQDWLPPLAPCTRAGEQLPLSYSQERLWILDRIEPGTDAYNIPVGLRLRGDLRPAALARALAEVVRRHGALRTSFPSLAGRPVQQVETGIAFHLPLADLAALDSSRREAEASRLAALEAAAPFDLTRPPLLRARLLRSTAAEWMLLLTVHHIAGDGWSLGILVTECTRLYRAFVQGERSPLSELAIQYADYSLWQRRWMNGEALGSQLAYWRRKLAGLPPALELPTDHPRPAVRSYRGDRRGLVLPAELTADLGRMARRAGATPFMTLLAAFFLLLERQSGESDLAVGTPIAGRGRAELEGLIGMFLNTLVLRVDVGGDPSFAEVLGRVRETALAAYAHQDVPFEMLIDELQPERDLSRTPFFQVFFNMLNFPLPEIELPGVALDDFSVPEAPSKFDLTAYLQPRGEQLEMQLVFNADLFSPERIEELLAQYRLLLEQAAADPGRRVAELSLLTPRAAALLPDPLAALDASWHGAVHEMVAAQAAAAPAAIAIREPGRSWTYRDLDQQSNRLAHRLLELGLQREQPVAVYAHRSAALVGAVLGILKAGGAFLLLDPAYPPARQIEILEIGRPAAWLQLEDAGPLSAELAAHLATSLPPERRLLLPPWRNPAGAESVSTPEIAVGPRDLAYLAFTSGSTGVPKGIQGLHGSLSHFLPWMAERYGFGPADRFSMLSALAHDPLQRDLFTPLCLGGTVCIPDPREMMAAGYLAAWMRREAVTVANLTPAMAQVLTEPADEAALPSLRLVFLVGDVLTRWIVARLRRLAPGVTCVNHYGSTETQRAVGYHVLPPAPAQGGGDERSREILPLGRGIPDVQLLVLRPGGRRAGIGEVGEIALRSPHIARGYLGDPELTRARFPVNPYSGDPADRIYWTGDLGRYLPDGQVTFAGRADQQVKVRGFRIELGEIEGRLCRLPGVREAVVLAKEERGERRLVAYVVPETGSTVLPAELREGLKEQVPAYMVPAAFVLLPQMLLTPNGKVDRRALLRLEIGPREEEMSYKEPETEIEKKLAGILQEVLQLERVGAEDNFFDLGGNSLLLVQVHARLQQEFGREIPVVDLFSRPSVTLLASYLADSGIGEAPAAVALTEERSEKLLAGRDRLRRRLEQRQRT